MDPELLAALDATEEVEKEGRSAVMRRAVAEYLERQRSAAIREQYERAYGDGDALGEDFEGWAGEGAWLER
jgi:predicted transcriptional regulator